MKQVFTIPRKCLTQEREQNLLNKGFEKEEHFLTIPLKYLLMRGRYEKTIKEESLVC